VTESPTGIAMTGGQPDAGGDLTAGALRGVRKTVEVALTTNSQAHEMDRCTNKDVVTSIPVLPLGMRGVL
jgi:hypothetical protein